MATTREQVLDTVTGLLARDASATTSDIAEAAGISRATLNRLFTDRDELVRALLERCVHQVVGAVDRAEQRFAAGTPLITALAEEVLPEATAFAFLAVQPAAYGEDADRIFDGVARRLDTLVLAAQRDGVLRTDLPAAWISDVLQALALAGAESQRLGRIAPRDTAALVVEVLRNGIGPTR